MPARTDLRRCSTPAHVSTCVARLAACTAVLVAGTAHAEFRPFARPAIAADAPPVDDGGDGGASTAPDGGSDDTKISVLFDAGWQSSSKFDRGGRISRVAGQGAVRVDQRLSDDLHLTIGAEYMYQDFRFRGPFGAFAGAPWDSLHRVSAGAVLRYRVSDDWMVMGGPVARFAFEDGGNLGDSFRGGGAISAVVRIDDDLRIGAGFGIVSRLERDAQIYPVIVFDWRIAGDWRLTTSGMPPYGNAGLELVYEMGEGIEFGFGAAYERDEYRLSDTNVQPGGVGEFRGTHLYARASYRISDRVSLALRAGLLLSGDVRIYDERGNRTATDDFDPAPGVIGSVTIRF